MTFSVEIKKELLDQNFNKKQFKTFLRGFILTSGIFKDDKWWCKLSNDDLRLKMVSLCALFEIEHWFNLDGSFLIFANQYNIIDEIAEPKFFYSGVFAARGSIADNSSSVNHLEFSCVDDAIFNFIMKKLQNPDYDFSFRTIKRANKNIAYIKRKDSIANFLAAIGASRAYLNFYQNVAERDIRAHATKQANLDVVNSVKVIEASSNHLIMINFIFKKNLQFNFNDRQLLFFNLKQQHPYHSLESLREEMEQQGFEISRSGLHHWLRKLKKVYVDNMH